LAGASEEAARFVDKAVVTGRERGWPDGCPRLYAALAERGYRCHPLPMSEFLKAGGACKCLTLFLPQR
jgi:N-dimethylarginine dimethylaminohydrolase